jgi:hypothetical protein
MLVEFAAVSAIGWSESSSRSYHFSDQSADSSRLKQPKARHLRCENAHSEQAARRRQFYFSAHSGHQATKKNGKMESCSALTVGMFVTAQTPDIARDKNLP